MGRATAEVHCTVNLQMYVLGPHNGRITFCIIKCVLQAGIAKYRNSGDESCKSFYTFSLHFHIAQRTKAADLRDVDVSKSETGNT